MTPQYTKRINILLAPKQYKELKKEAVRVAGSAKPSMAELVREALIKQGIIS